MTQPHDARLRSTATPDAAAEPPTVEDAVTGPPLAGPIRHADTAPGVPGYTIEGALGRGGMGVVYKATHLKLKRTVALKMVLAGGHAGEQERARFKAEAEAVARLQHPNIVQVFEVGEHGGLPYCALEYVEGGSLAHKLSGKPLPPKEAAQLVEALSRAMHLAHSRNVVHRDLKPANILLAADGTPKVTDFGLARQIDADSGQTQAGQVMGTPSYMAPEQASGRAHEAGPAADVYALGAILYECLTGRPPFRAATVVETLEQARTSEPVPPRALNAAVPRDLETVCLKCLRKEPEKRYASAAEMADDLGRFLRGEPVRARPVGRWERAWRWCSRNPAVAGLSAAVALSLTAGAVASVSYALKADAKAREADRQREVAADKAKEAEFQAGLADARAKEATEASGQAKTAAEQARRERRVAQRRLYVSDMRLAQVAWEVNRLDRLRELLDGQRPDKTGGDDLRGFEWYYWQRLTRPLGRSFPGPEIVWDLAFHGNRELLLLTPPKLTVRALDLDSGQDRALWVAPVAVDRASFSADGLSVRSLERDRQGTTTLTVRETLTGRVVRQAPCPPDLGPPGVGSWAWSGDNRFVAAVRGPIRVYDASTGALLGPPPDRPILPWKGRPDGPNDRVEFSPGGELLAVAYVGGEAPHDPARHISLWEWKTGKKLWSTPFPGLGHAALQFSPDGGVLVCATMERPAIGERPSRALDARTGREMFVIPDESAAKGSPSRGDNTLAFSSDGALLVTRGAEGIVKVWDRRAGKVIRSFRGYPGGYVGFVPLRMSPDGACVAAFSNKPGANSVQLLEVGADREAVTISQDGMWSEPSFSPDGSRLLQCRLFTPKAVVEYDARTGREARALSAPGFDPLGAAYSPDGGRIAAVGARGQIRVWDAKTGGLLLSNGVEGPVPWALHGAPSMSVVFRQDGSVLAVAYAERLWLLDAATGKTLPAPGPQGVPLRGWLAGDPGQRLRQIGARRRPLLERLLDARTRFVAGGDRLIIMDNNQFIVLDGHTGEVLSDGLLPENTNRHVLSADGKEVAATTEERVKVWDLQSGRELRAFQSHTSSLGCLASSWAGDRYAAFSNDNSVRVWDAGTGQEVLALKLPWREAGVTGLAFSPDGRRLVATLKGGLVVWDASPSPD
jgi:WD40 repeat protein